MHDDNNKNLILATALSFLVILVWFIVFPPEQPVPPVTTETAQAIATSDEPNAVPTSANDAAVPSATDNSQSREDALGVSPRVKIDSKRVSGSISLRGALIDDLSLKNYNVHLNDESEKIVIFSPIQESTGYWAFHAWWSPDKSVAAEDIPSSKTLWQLKSGNTLSETSPISLEWDNGNGLIFNRIISIDEN